MRVLAIGATGFIGRHVLPLLVAEGHEVAVLHRGGTVLSPAVGVREIRGNRDRLADCRTEVQRFAPDVILDMILYTEQQAREMVNSFRGRVGRVVVASSADVYRNYDGLRVGRVYNVGDEPTVTEREWAERIADMAGWEGDVVAMPRAELPDDFPQPMDWRYHLWTDTTRLRSELRYMPPVSLDEALRRTIEWEYSQFDRDVGDAD